MEDIVFLYLFTQNGDLYEQALALGFENVTLEETGDTALVYSNLNSVPQLELETKLQETSSAFVTVLLQAYDFCEVNIFSQAQAEDILAALQYRLNTEVQELYPVAAEEEWIQKIQQSLK